MEMIPNRIFSLTSLIISIHLSLAPSLAPRGVGGRGSWGAWRRNPLQRSYLRIRICPGHPPGLMRGLCYRLLNIATNPPTPGGSMTMEINSKVISVFGFALIPPRAPYCHFRRLLFLYLTCLPGYTDQIPIPTYHQYLDLSSAFYRAK